MHFRLSSGILKMSKTSKWLKLWLPMSMPQNRLFRRHFFRSVETLLFYLTLSGIRSFMNKSVKSIVYWFHQLNFFPLYRISKVNNRIWIKKGTKIEQKNRRLPKLAMIIMTAILVWLYEFPIKGWTLKNWCDGTTVRQTCERGIRLITLWPNQIERIKKTTHKKPSEKL